jgi:hypothetical protein
VTTPGRGDFQRGRHPSWVPVSDERKAEWIASIRRVLGVDKQQQDEEREEPS